MRTFLAVLLIAAGCAAPASQPAVNERSIGGVRVFERAGDGSDALVVQDAIEWRGTFAIDSGCLVLTLDGADYSPVFASDTALRSALADIAAEAPGRGANSWSLQGSRVAESSRAGYAKVEEGCGRPPFLVSALSDPRPRPPGNG